MGAGLGGIIPPHRRGRRSNSDQMVFSSKLSLLELLGPLVVLCVAPEMVTGQHLAVYVDNQGSCDIYRKGYCTKCEYTSTVAKACWDVAEGLGTTLSVEKIRRCSDRLSIAADSLSKGDMRKFRTLVKERDNAPAEVPRTLLQWLKDPVDDPRLGAKLLLELSNKVEVVMC